jgi:hypothetical protein
MLHSGRAVGLEPGTGGDNPVGGLEHGAILAALHVMDAALYVLLAWRRSHEKCAISFISQAMRQEQIVLALYGGCVGGLTKRFETMKRSECAPSGTAGGRGCDGLR